MAKRVVQNEADKKKPVKKKRHGCRNCLISLLVFVVVICAGAYIAGDYFSKKFFNMSLWNVFGVMHDLRSANSKKIVTNGYSEGDYNSFDTQLKNQLFLNSDVDFGADDLIAALLEGNGGESEGDTLSVRGDCLYRTAGLLNAELSTDSLIDVISELYVKENIDLNRLNAYDISKHDSDYVLKISDKMLAAAINRELDTVGDSFTQISDMLGKFGIEKLSDIAKFEQMIFGETQGVKDDVSAKVKTVTVTVSVNARKIAKSYINDSFGKTSFGASALGVAVNMVLPKRFYVTAVIPVEENASIEHYLYINGMTASKMDRAYKLISGITAFTGDEINAKEKISETVTGAVGGVIGTVNGIFPLDSANGGVVKMDLFETVIDLGGLNKDENCELKPEEKQIHSSDIIQTLAGIVVSEADDAIKPEYDFMNQYLEDATNKVVYFKTKPVTGYTRVDYEQEFMNELARKYMLDLRLDDGDPSNDVTFKYLMDLFGMSGDGGGNSDELMDIFNASNLSELLKESDQRVRVNSRMLGAIFASQLESLTEGSLSEMHPELLYVFTDEKVSSVDGKAHNIMEAALRVEITSMLPEGGVGSLVSNLVGEKVVIAFRIDITIGGDSEFEYLSSEIMYNGLSKEKTDIILSTIGSFTDSLDAGTLLEQIEQPMRDIINSMNDVLGIKIESSKIDSDATNSNLPPALLLQDVFHTIKDMLFKDEEDISADDVRDVLTAIDEVNDAEFEESYLAGTEISTEQEGYKNSLYNILDAYYFKDAAALSEKTFDELFGDGGMLTSFDASLLDFDRLYRDNAETEDLKPLFTTGELGRVLLDEMGKEGNESIYADLMGIKGLKIEESASGEKLIIIIEIKTDALMGDGNGSEANKNSNLMPADVIYLKASVNLNRIFYYDKTGSVPDVYEEGNANIPAGFTPYYYTKIMINRMDNALFDKTMQMINVLNDGATDALDLELRAHDIGSAVYDSLKSVKDVMGGNLAFTSNGMVLGSVYDFINAKVMPDGYNATAEQIRAALQGLAAIDSESANNSRYNYEVRDLIVNTIEMGNAETDTTHLTASMEDSAFGYGLVNGFTVGVITTPAVIGGVEGFDLMQLNILSGDNARTVSRLQYLQGFNGASNPVITDGSKTYIEFTFKADMKNLIADGGDFNSVLPANIYVTVLLECVTDAVGKVSYKEVYYRINNMTQDAQNVLLTLAGISDDDMTKQIKECTDALTDGYGTATFTDVTGSGTVFGKITFTPKAA